MRATSIFEFFNNWTVEFDGVRFVDHRDLYYHLKEWCLANIVGEWDKDFRVGDSNRVYFKRREDAALCYIAFA